MGSENPFTNAILLHPGLTERVYRAYRLNLEDSLVPGSETANGVAVDSLAVRIRSATGTAKEKGATGLNSLDAITNPDIRCAFEDSLLAAEQLFERIDLATPTVDQCVDANVDLAALGVAYERMKLEGLEPMVILAPNLSIEAWEELYRNLADDKTVNAAGVLNKENNIVIINKVRESWDDLTVPPLNTPVIHGDEETPTWSLRIIPATASAPTTGPHDTSIILTIAEYISLQATLLQAGKVPIDIIADQTWLYGELDAIRDARNKAKAPTGFWSSTGRQLIICWDDTEDQMSLGIRQPVWR